MKNKAKLLTYPYIVWMGLFIILPVLLVFLYSITFNEINNIKTISFTINNYKMFFTPVYIQVTLRSIYLAALSTIICLALGYPIAMIIANSKMTSKSILLLLFILPMWMNMLLRTYAWMTILGNNGLINTLLANLGLPTLNLLYNNGAVILGMVYNFIPFMVLPIYTTLSKMDNSLIEVSEDLGANKVQTFIKVIFPLSLPGVISGIIMVFMPAVSSFVIPKLLGGGKDALIGTLIEKLFSLGDWNFGSAVSIVMMFIILLSMAVMNRFDVDKEGGAGLW